MAGKQGKADETSLSFELKVAEMRSEYERFCCEIRAREPPSVSFWARAGLRSTRRP